MKNIAAAFVAALMIGQSASVGAQNKEGDDPKVLTLENAIEKVLKTAPIMRAVEENIRAKNGTIQQAGVRPNPEVNMEIEEFAGSGVYNGLDRTEITIGVAQRFERGGKRQARVGLARSDRELAIASGVVTQMDMAYNVQRAYIEALSAGAYVSVVTKQRDIAQAFDKTVNSRVKNALETEAARQRSATLLIKANMEFEQARQNYDLAKIRLASLWGEADTNFQVQLDLFRHVELVNYRAIKSRLEITPDLQLVQLGANRAQRALNLEKARAKQDPSFSLGLRQFQRSNDVAAVLSFSIPFSLFDKNRGNISKASAERRKSEWMVRDAELKFEGELATGIATFESAFNNAVAYRDQIIPQAQTTLIEIGKVYEKGAATYIEVVEAQRVLEEYRSQEISALKSFHLSAAALDRLLATYNLSPTFNAPLLSEEIKK